ncbi:MAG: GNAT family N-acetyltransferase [Verrucomicrobiota bacterium]
MPPEIFTAETDAEIESCFPVFSVLRPHLERGDFLPQVRRQQHHSYQIAAVRHDGKVVSIAGFRITEFLAWGKILYLDDLATLPGETSHGFASLLLDHLATLAKSHGCRSVQLDTGFARHAAHRLYLRKGFQLSCHHLTLPIASAADSLP